MGFLGEISRVLAVLREFAGEGNISRVFTKDADQGHLVEISGGFHERIRC